VFGYAAAIFAATLVNDLPRTQLIEVIEKNKVGENTMRNRVKGFFPFSSRKLICSFLGAFLVFTPLTTLVASRSAEASTETGDSSSSATTTGFLRNLTSQASAQSPDRIWQFVEESSIISSGKRQIVPQIYRTARVNETGLKQALDQAPLEFTKEAQSNNSTLDLPMPDGSFSTFRIEMSPIMEAPLAAQYPEIKTYRGQGIDDPAATARFDLTPAGFHAMVLSERGTVYVDPYAKDDTTNYISYFKHDYRNEAKALSCFFTEDDNVPQGVSQPEAPNVLNGTILRTYRLALAATGEYTVFTGGTVATALAAMTTTVNRVDGIYERELAVRMVLIANENLIIYTNGNTDPYTNNNGVTMLGQNQANLDAVIGTANYDIGHVLSTGGGGVAGLGVVCTGSKARGVTGSPSPVGDGFDVDYVAHEMGHQFGGSHTFNGTTSNCNGNRSSSAAYEPGSGSTIMAYAGICGSQNLQLHSDDYFHVKSLEQIAAFIGGNSCDVETNTGNTLPTVTAGAAVTIPKSTPFALTASGNDPNGDALTYCWEEYDIGPSSPPDTDADGSVRPIFRSFNPTTGPSRTFPKLSDVLNNTSTTGEALPTMNRTMTFQVTVRDNRIGGGGINTATAQVVVSTSAGPFLVTQPNTNVSWTGGTQQTINWNVANTSAAPVSTDNVKISLSTDGGNSFPIVLAPSTSNDGSESISVPDTSTTSARIKVEAVGNIFFDVSDANFTIVQGAGGTDTIGLYNPGGAAFFLRNSNTGGVADIAFTFGPAGLGLVPLTGDWDGNGTDSTGLYNPATGTFFLKNTNSGGVADNSFAFGPAGTGWLPLVGDWDGNGIDTIGLYNPTASTFFLKNSNSTGVADVSFAYGPAGAGWIPIVGDWDGNGTTTIGLYNPTAGTFFLRNTNSTGVANVSFAFGPGGAGWKPVIGDWNGDGTDTIGLYNPSASAFFLRNSNSSGVADVSFAYGPPGAGWTPLVGDWNGL
jgi:hypothetical protein